jgi:hypothetical protein
VADETYALYTYYRRNLDAWETNSGAVEPHWNQAFTAARDSTPLPFAPVTLSTRLLARFPEANAVVIEAIARIRWDLSRAIVDAMRQHPKLTMDQVYDDFEKLLPLLEEAEEKVLSDLPPQQRDFLLIREGSRFFQSSFSRQSCHFDLELERTLALFQAAQVLHQPLTAGEYEEDLVKRLASDAGTSPYIARGILKLVSMFDERSQKELTAWLKKNAPGCCHP